MTNCCIGPSNPPSRGGGGGVLQSTTVTLSSAQILAASVSPPTIIVQPGVGQSIQVMLTIYNYIFGTVPYTSGDGFISQLQYGASGTIADTGDGNILEFSANGVAQATSDVNSGLSSSFENQPIVWVANQPYLGGDGTLTITVFYLVVPVT